MPLQSQKNQYTTSRVYMSRLAEEYREVFDCASELNDYDVIKPIGKGKFSTVFKAKRLRDDQLIALKQISMFNSMDTKAQEKTLKEVRLVQSVTHPNIIQYIDAFISNNDLYIAFEWAAAGDLKRQIRKAIEKNIRFSEPLIWKYFTQLCSAIAYLHGKRILHRDIKPANIFITSEGRLKLGDLGLSRMLDENSLVAQTKVGTPLYMSPEVLRGDPYDGKCDIWSLGCILYELAMLRSPFKEEGLTLAGLFQKVILGKFDPIPEALYSERFRSLVVRMIKLKPSHRLGVEAVLAECRSMEALYTKDVSVTTNQFKVTTSAMENEAINALKAKQVSAKKSIRQEESLLENMYPVPLNQASNEGSPRHSQYTVATFKEIRDTCQDKLKADLYMDIVYEGLKLLQCENILGTKITKIYFIHELKMSHCLHMYREHNHHLMQNGMPGFECTQFHVFVSIAGWLLASLGVSTKLQSVLTNLNTETSKINACKALLLAAAKVGIKFPVLLTEKDLSYGYGFQVCCFMCALVKKTLNKAKVCHRLPIYLQDSSSNINDSEIGDMINDADDRFTNITDSAEPYYTTTEIDLNVLPIKNIMHSSIDPKAWQIEKKRVLPRLDGWLSRIIQLTQFSSAEIFMDMTRKYQSIVEGRAGDSVCFDALNRLSKLLHTAMKQVKTLEKLVTLARQADQEYHKRLVDQMSTNQRKYIHIKQQCLTKASQFRQVAQLLLEKQEKLQLLQSKLMDVSKVKEIERKLYSIKKENRAFLIQQQILQSYIFATKISMQKSNI